MKQLSLCILLTMLITSFTTFLQAQIPRTLSYQGVLTDSLGNPKSDGSHTITFRLFTVSSGGSYIWTEQKTISTKRGLFSTILGDQTLIPDSVEFDKPYWLSLQVASEPELSPRIPLTAVGYSLYSIKADTAKYAITAPQQHFVDSARVADTVPSNSITSQKILDGTIQRSDVISTFTSPYADTALFARSAPQSGFMDSARIAGTVTDNAITSSKIADGTIQRVDLKSSFKSPYADTADAVRSLPPITFADSARVAGTIPNNSITSAKIADGTIQRADVTTNFMAPYADTAVYARSAPQSASVDSARIAGTVADGAVTTTNLADGAVTNTKISPPIFLTMSSTSAVLRSINSGGGNSIWGQNSGTSGSGGLFQVSLASNSSPTLEAYTIGGGEAGYFHIDNTSNNSVALETYTNGGGSASHFHIDNAQCPGNAVWGSSIGSGNVFFGYNTGTGRAGLFQIGNVSNFNPALESSTNGTGDVMFAHTNGTGRGGLFQVDNPSNFSAALEAVTNGTGRAGRFHIENSSNVNVALHGFTVGTGSAGYFQINNPSNSNAALEGITNGTGNAVFGNNGATGCTGYLGGSYGANGTRSNYIGYLGFSDGGVLGQDLTTGNNGYLGMSNYGVRGSSNTGQGVHGESSSGIGVHGESTTGDAIHGYTTSGLNGMVGESDGVDGNGVFGIADNGGNAYGVFGSSTNGVGVIGHTNTGIAVRCDGKFYQSAGVFEAYPTSTIWSTNKPATVKLDDGSKVKLFTEEATEVYFTDYGEGTLSGGRTHIKLDPIFLETVTIDGKHPMKVFVQLEDDCNGVYVTNKSRTGFDVVELHNGTSNAHFSYRVVCKRKYYEDERLATEEQDTRFNTAMLKNVWPEVSEKHQAEQTKIKLIEDRQKLTKQNQR